MSTTKAKMPSRMNSLLTIYKRKDQPTILRPQSHLRINAQFSSSSSTQRSQKSNSSDRMTKKSIGCQPDFEFNIDDYEIYDEHQNDEITVIQQEPVHSFDPTTPSESTFEQSVSEMEKGLLSGLNCLTPATDSEQPPEEDVLNNTVPKSGTDQVQPNKDTIDSSAVSTDVKPIQNPEQNDEESSDSHPSGLIQELSSEGLGDEPIEPLSEASSASARSDNIPAQEETQEQPIPENQPDGENQVNSQPTDNISSGNDDNQLQPKKDYVKESSSYSSVSSTFLDKPFDSNTPSQQSALSVATFRSDSSANEDCFADSSLTDFSMSDLSFKKYVSGSTSQDFGAITESMKEAEPYSPRVVSMPAEPADDEPAVSEPEPEQKSESSPGIPGLFSPRPEDHDFMSPSEGSEPWTIELVGPPASIPDVLQSPPPDDNALRVPDLVPYRKLRKNSRRSESARNREIFENMVHDVDEPSDEEDYDYDSDLDINKLIDEEVDTTSTGSSIRDDSAEANDLP